MANLKKNNRHWDTFANLKTKKPLRYILANPKTKKTMPSNHFCWQVDTAAKFVQDIIDKAKTEAAKKLNSEQIVSTSISYTKEIEGSEIYPGTWVEFDMYVWTK